MNLDTDKTFKALADPSRRLILDIVKNKLGININEVSDNFEFSRFAVMKHIKILEEAELIVHKREGKFKKLYINVMPIQAIYDRWISKYSGLWAKGLTSLKYQLEKEGEMTDKELKHVFVLYIKTTKKKLWEALTNSELTLQYYYGMAVNSDFTEGSKIEYHGKNKEGKDHIPVAGEIIEAVPYEKLVHSFWFPEADDKPSRVQYDIEEAEGIIKLTLTHDGFETETETFKSVVQGWPLILSGLKTLLETDSPLQ